MEIVVCIESIGLVPGTFVNTNHFSALYRETAVGKKIWRVGENHVKVKCELWEKLKRIALQNSEIAIR